jgi:hypothetical protein
MTETLKLNELMVGDWVMYNPNVFIEDEYEPTKECYPTKIENGEDIDLSVEDCYTPIPLTPEILKKNGFVELSINKTTYKCIVDSKFDYASAITIDLFSKDDCDVVNSENKRSYHGKIEYVHELQQIIRMCGLKKQIKP